MANQSYVSKVDSLFAGDNDYKRVTGRYPWEPETKLTKAEKDFVNGETSFITYEPE